MRSTSSTTHFSISIHALREEGDPHSGRPSSQPADFYPRPPRGGRPFTKTGRCPQNGFLSTPSARRATNLNDGEIYEMEFLSTPSARRATRRCAAACGDAGNFYPRPPRGGRPFCRVPKSHSREFLSTPSARRATSISRPTTTSALNFYPRPPRGGRPPKHHDSSGTNLISIHALREEGDLKSMV